MATYQIYELSARAVMSYAAEQDGVYTFALNRSATEHCKVGMCIGWWISCGKTRRGYPAVPRRSVPPLRRALTGPGGTR